MPIWKGAEVPESIPFQQSQRADGVEWSADQLTDQWADADRAAHPELGEVTEGMIDELRDFIAAHWFGRMDVMSLASMAQGMELLKKAGWDLERLSVELRDGEMTLKATL